MVAGRRGQNPVRVSATTYPLRGNSSQVLPQSLAAHLPVRPLAQRRHIEIDPVARRRRQLHEPVLHHQRRHRDRIAGGLEVHEALGEPEIRDHRRNGHRRRQPDQGGIVVVRRDRHRLRRGHRGDVHQRGDPAAVAHVRVQDVGRAAFQAVEERLLRIHRLPGHDRHRQGAADFGHQLDVVAEAGFLVPADVELGEPLPQPDRVHWREAAVHLDQQAELRAQRFAHRADVADHVVLVLAVDEAAPGAGERVPFQRGEARFLHRQGALDIGLDRVRPARPAVGIGFHPRPRRAAEQIVQRHPRLLGDDVPQRDLDRAPGRAELERGAPHGEILEDHLRGVADGKRAAPDHHAGHGGEDVGHRLFLARGHVGFAPAMQAAFGLDPAEQQVLGGAGVEQECLDPRDLHGRLPRAETGPGRRGCPSAGRVRSSAAPAGSRRRRPRRTPRAGVVPRTG